MDCSKRFFEIILLFLVITFFSLNTDSFLSISIEKILNDSIGFVLFLSLAIYFVVKKEFIYLAIILFIIMKHSKSIEGAGEADDEEDDELKEAKKQTKAEVKEEAAAIKKDLGVDKNMFNDGDKIESFWDLLAQAKKNANKILDSSSKL